MTQMNDLEMSPQAFAIWMILLAAYFVFAFSITFAATTYSPNYKLHSAELIRDPEPSVRVDITFKQRPTDRAEEVELGIWAPDGPPYHMQEVGWDMLAARDNDPRTTPSSPPAPGTRSTFVVPLDAENRSRLARRRGSDPFEVQFHWGWSRYVRIDVEE